MTAASSSLLSLDGAMGAVCRALWLLLYSLAAIYLVVISSSLLMLCVVVVAVDIDTCWTMGQTARGDDDDKDDGSKQ